MRHLSLALSLIACTAIGQAQTALPFLEITPSELGGASVARPDVQTFVQNPALLGLMGGETRAAASGTPTGDWLGELSHGTGTALVGGDLGPITLGVGAARGELRGELRTLGDGTPFQPADRYSALAVGVSTRGAVRAAAGMTGRHITTTDAPTWNGERFTTQELTGASLDLGAAVAVDIDQLTDLPRLGPLRPTAQARAGYAQTHIGGMVQYAGFGSQPLPRTAALGWSATLGLDLPSDRGTLRLVEIEVAAQAERSLVQTNKQAYSPVLGGLSPLRATVGAGDEGTTGRRGLRFVLAETFAFSTGRHDGWGYDDVRSRSAELRAGGALHLLANAIDLPAMDDLARRTDFRLGRVTTYAGTADQSTRTQLTLVVRR